MRDRILAALLTVAVFAVGFLSGRWSERHCPVPPPPAAFMGEFGGAKGAGPNAAAKSAPPVNRAQLADQIEKLRPEIESFRQRIMEIYAGFDRDIEPILSPEQREIYQRRFKALRGFGPPPEIAAGDKPLSDEQIDQLLQRPFRTLAYFVVIPMTMERMGKELKLDDVQREKVKDFLRVRREKFTELVDSVPPPSLLLSRLAPVAARLGEPSKAAPAPAH